MIPDDLTQLFPEFIDTDNIEFDGPQEALGKYSSADLQKGQ